MKKLILLFVVLIGIIILVYTIKSKTMVKRTFKLDITWHEFLKQMLKGKCPINNWPDYEFMIKFHPVTDLSDKVIYKFVKANFPKGQDLKPFSEFFLKNNSNKLALNFPNKRETAIMVVPSPDKNKDFAHLYNFLNQSNETQRAALWKEVAKAFTSQKTKTNTLYLSTHGLGVNYLHIRIKASPDYGYPTNF